MMQRVSSVRWLCAQTQTYASTSRRYLLSAAYALPKWTDELSTNVKHMANNQKFDSFEYLSRMQRLAKSGSLLTAADLDLAVHCMEESSQFDIIKDLMYRYRRSDQNHHTLDSTHDAVVRQALRLDTVTNLMHMLSDTLNYGLLPSEYAVNSLIDHHIKHEQWADACNAATYLMQQELLDSPISQYISIYSCAKWIETANNLDNWDNIEGEDQAQDTDAPLDDDDDQQIEFSFKVPYLKNPYFDDHFDLDEPRQLVGKTLFWMGKALAQSNKQSICGHSAALLGCALFGHAQQMPVLLQDLIEGKHSVLNTVIAPTKAAVQYWSERTATHSQSEQSTAADTLQVLPSPTLYDQSLWTQIQDLLSELSVVESERSLSEQVLLELENKQDSWEADDLQTMHSLIEKWNTDRLHDKAVHEDLLSLEQRLNEIEQTRQELNTKDTLLAFFDNRERYEQMADWDVHERASVTEGEEQVLSDDQYAQLLVTKFKETRRSSTKK